MTKQESKKTVFIGQLRLFVLIVAIAFSFGGFTFYSAIVVKIGGEVLDATMQGFVTRLVTHVLNIASAITLLVFVWEAIASKNQRKSWANICFFSMLGLYSLCLITLVLVHPRLDALLDPDTFAVANSDRFYVLHRIYLISNSIQWLATLALIALICFTGYQQKHSTIISH